MDHLLGKFNAHLSSALVVFADEIVWGGNKREAGQLKGIITETRRMMEAKFKDPILVDNYARFIFATNDEWAVPTGPKERRYCVLKLDESRLKTYAYFAAINTEMRNGGVEASNAYSDELRFKPIQCQALSSNRRASGTEAVKSPVSGTMVV